MSTTLSSDPAEIRNRMSRLRKHVDSDIQKIIGTSSGLFDWKEIFQRYPQTVIGAAILAGYFLSPGRRVVQQVKLDEESLRGLVDQPAEPSPGEMLRETLVQTACSAIAGTVASGVLGLLKRNLEDWLENKSPATEEKSTETKSQRYR